MFMNPNMSTSRSDSYRAIIRPPILFLAVCSFGVSAILTQLVLMRELVSVFSGNELIFGIVLGNWMLLTGIGSALGKTVPRLKSPVAVLVLLQILIALLPIIGVFLLRTLRNAVFIRGAEVGVTETVASCFVLMAPYCLATGYLLTLACQAAAEILPSPAQPSVGARRGAGSEGVNLCKMGNSESPDAIPLTLTLSQRERGGNSIGQVYFFDNLGGVLGGALFTFVLVLLFSHFGILYFPAALNLAFAVIVAVNVRKHILATAATIALAGLAAAAVFFNLDDISCNIQYSGQKVVYHGASPYGMLVVTEDAGQYNFIENGVVLFATHNAEQVEETVHYAMAQRPDAKRVLLISGGVSGTAQEILKYPVDAVDYVELDPKILDIANRFLPGRLDDPRIHVINADGRRYVKDLLQKSPLPLGEGQGEGCRYDVVIIDAPSPSTSQINRLYTREFFDQVRRVLVPGGVVSFSLTGYEGYISKELARLIAVADRTLGQVYKNVLILPGMRIFFLASDGPLTADVAGRIEQAGIKTRLVNRSYVKAMFTPDRMADVRRALSPDAPVNEDFNPILYFYHLRYWMSQFDTLVPTLLRGNVNLRFGIFEGVLLLVLLIYLLRLRPAALAIFTGGLAASALEVVLLLGFQILYGSLYHQVGLIVTMFMLGLGIGSFVMNRLLARWGRKQLIGLALAIAAYAACIPYALLALGRVESHVAAWAAWAAVPAMTLLLAALVGMEFPLAGKVTFQSAAATASRLYTADYIGAALGALLVSTWLIPVLGVTVVCLLTAGLNLFSAGMMMIRR
jgi:spermidine synthase